MLQQVIGQIFPPKGAPAPQIGSSWSVSTDKGDTISVLILSNNRILLDSAIVGVPAEPLSRQTLLRDCLNRAVVRMPNHPESLALNPAGNQLHLQQFIQAETTTQFQQSFDKFAKAVHYWKTRPQANKGPASIRNASRNFRA
jgi:hypothetical protein